MQLRFQVIHAGVLLAFALFSAGCGASTPSIRTPELTETVAARTITSAPTLISLPTTTQETATAPSPLSDVILLAPPGADPKLVRSLESTLTELASGEGLQFERRDSLTPEELNSQTRLVVGVAPAPRLPALAAAAPQVQFLSVDTPGITNGVNISIIAAQASPGEQLGFLAGYLAAMVTPEWRVGVLAPGDTSDGVAARQGFANGVVFFCGLCRQTYPPFITYPLFGELPSSASPDEWQAAAQVLIDQSVQTVYLAPGVDSEALSTYLGKAGVKIIANSPPPAGLADQWVATLQADPAKALQDLWPSLLEGNEGSTISIPLSVDNFNEEILTPGRMRLLEEAIADLESGYIDPGTGQAQGE